MSSPSSYVYIEIAPTDVEAKLPPFRHFMELHADDESTTSKLAAHQGRKSVGGIALHAIGAQVTRASSAKLYKTPCSTYAVSL